MKVCPNCQTKYPDDGNFCPQESCATAEGPRRLVALVEEPPPRFQMGERLGGTRGGEVWKATDSHGGGEVAYKLVAAAVLPTPTAMERALRELKQLTRAQNPHVARIVDFGKNADGRLFVAMELAAGAPLDQVVRESGPLPLERAKKIVAQIGEALLEGQRVGVIHHDLGAKNVLVGPGDEVKVINFPTPRPLSETVFGVADYVSPEQAEGKLVDQRSNTYNLGALLMLMLTGEPPFTGPDEQAVLQSVLHDELVPPSRRNPSLSPEIDRLVGKALERNSSRRPLTLRQFLTDVAALTPPLPGATPGSTGGVTVGAGKGNFAKTMMFAGGAPEIQKLIEEAAAARAEANGSGGNPSFAPVNGSPSNAPTANPEAVAAEEAAAAKDTPQPVPVATEAPSRESSGPRRGHGAAIAATMVAMPVPTPSAAAGSSPSGGSNPGRTKSAEMKPPENPASVPDPSKAGAGGQGGNFRETLWFKKGDVDQMVADAKAKLATGKSKPAAPGAELPEITVEDGKPLEDRYVDDGSVTVEDRKKFSLRSGATATGLPMTSAVPGSRMSDSEMLDEIGGGRRVMIIGVAAAVAVALTVVLVVVFKGKSEPTPPPAAAPVAVPAPGPPAAPPPTAGTPPTAAATAPTPEPTNAGEAAAKEAAAKAHPPPPPKKRVVAKKKPPPPPAVKKKH